MSEERATLLDYHDVALRGRQVCGHVGKKNLASHAFRRKAPCMRQIFKESIP